MNNRHPHPESPEDSLDRFMNQELNSIPLPSGGLEQVLAAVKAAQAAQVAQRAGASQNVIQGNFSRRSWVKIGLGAAASIVGGIGFYFNRAGNFDRNLGPATADAFAADCVAKARGLISLAKRSPDWTDLAAHLRAQAIPVSSAGSQLSSLRPRGCQTYAWRGSLAGLTCFKQSDGTLVHLFTLPKAAAQGAENLPATPGLANITDERAWAQWTESAAHCVLVSGDDGANLDEALRLLRSSSAV
jgi:hypothetical protein